MKLSGYERLKVFVSESETNRDAMNYLSEKLGRNVLVNIADYAYEFSIHKYRYSLLVKNLKEIFNIMNSPLDQRTYVSFFGYDTLVFKEPETFVTSIQIYMNRKYYEGSSGNRLQRFHLYGKKKEHPLSMQRKVDTNKVLADINTLKHIWNKKKNPIAFRKRLLKEMNIKGYTKLSLENSDEFFKQIIYRDDIFKALELAKTETLKMIQRQNKKFERKLGRPSKKPIHMMSEKERIDYIYSHYNNPNKYIKKVYLINLRHYNSYSSHLCSMAER